jgi:NAD(P)-dependent dehydrogenase (short-subunit alcohol dehydrogenase family)
MRLVLVDLDEGPLKAAAEALTAAGAAVLPIALDVADREPWDVAMARVRGFGALHLVCANAGIAPAGAPLTTMAPEAWDRILAINLTGVFNTVQAAAPLLRSLGEGGHLVLTSSMAGMIAASPIGDYAVTKYGVSALGEALRAELAPERIGVSVLYPGVVATPLVGESRSVGMSPEAVAARVILAIEADELFIFTHADYRPLVAARAEAILAAFGASAEPGFVESPGVLSMMRSSAYPPDA